MTKVKICGLTNIDDYNAAVMLGADYVGFVFYEWSPRFVAANTAGGITRNGLRRDGVKRVGVFVNMDPHLVQKIYYAVDLDIVQLHGEESPDYCKKLGLPYWKVVRVRDKDSLACFGQYDCEAYLLDTCSQGSYGGTGCSFDHMLARAAIQSGEKIVIAGGVSEENIKEILALTPYCVDINSSLEVRPGKKDARKMESIINVIRRAR